jgi:hypothetical protein
MNNESVGEMRMYDEDEEKIRVPNPGEIETYVYESLDEKKYQSVEVYPILKSGALCEKTDTRSLRKC